MSNDFDLSQVRSLHLYDGLEEEVVITGERVTINGPAGDIEALTAVPSNASTDSPIAVLCHPHPLYGGTMNNKVVHMLSMSHPARLSGSSPPRFPHRSQALRINSGSTGRNWS